MDYLPASRSRRQWPAIPFTIFSLVAAAAAGAAPATANAYGTCASRLVATGLSAEAAATACAQTYSPDELSRCVSDIVERTGLEAATVLSACSRDRRPLELSSCVNDIHGSLALSATTQVLDSCRLSILPLRYAECVVGIEAEAALGIDDSLSTCLSAGYRPEDVAPTFIFEPDS